MKRILFCLVILVVTAPPACSQRAWYEGIKQKQRNECYQAPPGAREECLRAIDNESYGAYQKKRQENY